MRFEDLSQNLENLTRIFYAWRNYPAQQNRFKLNWG